jgi:hypothetical protein
LSSCAPENVETSFPNSEDVSELLDFPYTRLTAVPYLRLSWNDEERGFEREVIGDKGNLASSVSITGSLHCQTSGTREIDGE